ncbi:hypothetical protein [Trinickia acidisoli]|uniref:hypothetical protein n=1 Tax=Trinickia acidisoli TaxID=2767482 RepID=UPI001A8D2010|nr:hypothetical protein [Trinickia acidisoli]
MAFLVLPVMVVLFYLGMAMEFNQWAQAVPGAGKPGQMVNVATVSAQQAEVFGAACLDTATATAGMISSSITVTLPTGVTTPANAVCMTTSAGGGTRNVYAYAPAVSGEAGQVMTDSDSSAAWFLVPRSGRAVGIVSGQPSAIPATIPAGSLLAWFQVNP